MAIELGGDSLGTVTTALVALAGLWVAGQHRRGDRQHEQRLQADATREAYRSEQAQAYIAAVAWCERTYRAVQAVESPDSFDVPAAEEPGEEFRIRGRLAAYGSGEVLTAFELIAVTAENYGNYRRLTAGYQELADELVTRQAELTETETGASPTLEHKLKRAEESAAAAEQEAKAAAERLERSLEQIRVMVGREVAPLTERAGDARGTARRRSGRRAGG